MKFGANWCGPCVNLAPKLEEFAQSASLQGKVKFASVDTDKCKGVSDEMDVSSIPDTRLFINGKELGKVIGNNIDAIRTLV